MGEIAYAVSLNYSKLGALRRHHGGRQQKDSSQDLSGGLLRVKQAGGHPLLFHYGLARTKLELGSYGHRLAHQRLDTPWTQDALELLM
jgi:hypothetical protein